jgi:hypothetical protein
MLLGFKVLNLNIGDCDIVILDSVTGYVLPEEIYLFHNHLHSGLLHSFEKAAVSNQIGSAVNTYIGYTAHMIICIIYDCCISPGLTNHMFGAQKP